MPDERPTRPPKPPRPAGQAARTSGQTARISGASARTHSLKQKLIAAFTERLPFKATALFFALVLWLIVSAEEPISGQVPVRFVPTVDTSLQLIGQLPDISAYVVGTRSDLLRLTTSPPSIHFSVPSDAPDTLRVRLDTLALTMPSGVNVSVRRIQPDVVTLRFGSEIRRRLPVRSALRYSADSGFVVAGSPSFTPESVQVVGPRRRVQALEGVPTIASDLVVRDTQPIVVPLDTSGLGVRVTPTEVRVRIPIAPDTVTPDTIPPQLTSGPSSRARRGILPLENRMSSRAPRGISVLAAVEDKMSSRAPRGISVRSAVENHQRHASPSTAEGTEIPRLRLGMTAVRAGA